MNLTTIVDFVLMYKFQLKDILFLVVTCGLINSGVNAQDYCQIDIDEVSEDFNPPLLVRPERHQVLYPELRDGIRLMSIASGTEVLAACPGKRNNFINSEARTRPLICSDGQLIQSESQTITSWENLGCERRPRAYLRKIRNSVCGEDGTRYDIGWTIRTNLYIPLINFCFDTERETTEFSFHKIQGRIIGVKSVDSSRPGFRSASLFTSTVGQNYKRKTQFALFTDLLGTSEHLTSQGQHYLSRGHLAPDSDFFYAAEQDATYFYGNVMPQWQAFNNGNWKRLEFAVRELAEKHQATFHVWTGGYGTLQMPDVNNNAVNMYLGLAEGKKLLPVPALMWKVVYNPSTRQAVAIVAINDVRGRAMSADVSLTEPPCTDICKQLDWIDWDTNDIRRGRMFCCQVRDLRVTIPALPDLGRVELLDK